MVADGCGGFGRQATPPIPGQQSIEQLELRRLEELAEAAEADDGGCPVSRRAHSPVPSRSNRARLAAIGLHPVRRHHLIVEQVSTDHRVVKDGDQFVRIGVSERAQDAAGGGDGEVARRHRPGSTPHPHENAASLSPKLSRSWKPSEWSTLSITFDSGVPFGAFRWTPPLMPPTRPTIRKGTRLWLC